jgi:tRNA modification GTPase
MVYHAHGEMSTHTDTIVAQATPSGHGGVSIVRLSGPLTQKIAKIVLGKLPDPRVACVTCFKDKNQQVIDHGIAIFFSAPHSFTGEDVLELQGHGGPVIVNLLIENILALGARLARPGEFSERAFLNGKIDLAQAEAIADLIHAATEQAAKSAMRSLQGDFSHKIKKLVEAVIQLRMYIEAAIDFAEEEIDFLSDQHLHQRFKNIHAEVIAVKNAARQGTLLRDGITVVIAGKPNAGKSTLLNKLSGKDLAIVTDIPGTTRDILREHIHIDGLPLHIMDTAGLRETLDKVEQEGIKRAYKEIEQADLVLYLVEGEDLAEFIPAIPDTVPIIIVRNKIDLTHDNPTVDQHGNKTFVAISAKMNVGLDLLKAAIKSSIGFSTHNEGTFSARQRHIDALERAAQSLTAAYHQLIETKAGELVAEDLRQAQRALDEITGEFSTEDLLGRIFSSFCIGK